MTGDPKKLMKHKPKKARGKQHQKKGKECSTPPPSPPLKSPSSSSSSIAGAPKGVVSPSLSMGSQGTPPPPPLESFSRRYKYLWPVLLAFNFSVGGVEDKAATKVSAAAGIPLRETQQHDSSAAN